MNPVSRVML